MGNFYTAITKKRYSYENLSDFRPSIEDIAFVLANSTLNRYGGLLPYDVNYSVAHHSLILANYSDWEGLGSELALKCLLHDAPEAFLLDVPSGLKDSLGHRYADLEIDITRSILSSLGIDKPLYWLDDPTVKQLDSRIVANEILEFFRHHPTITKDANYRDALEIPRGVFSACYKDDNQYKHMIYRSFLCKYEYLIGSLK